MSITLPNPALSQAPSCFSWCAHGDQFPGEHESAAVALHLPDIAGESVPSSLIAVASIAAGPHHRPRVSIEFDEFGVSLDREAAGILADRLITFAARLRELAHLVDDASGHSPA